MHTKDKGDIAEIATIFRALKRGWSVSKPVGENQRYDLIIDDGNQLLRVQCKSAKLKKNIIRASLTRMIRKKDKYQRERYTAKEIDVFSVYCPDTDQCYFIPVGDVSCDGVLQTNINLRLEASDRSNQHKPRFADDYVL